MNDPLEPVQAGRHPYGRLIVVAITAGIAELPVLARTVVDSCAVTEDEVEDEVRDRAIIISVAAVLPYRSLGFDSLENGFNQFFIGHVSHLQIGATASYAASRRRLHN